MLPLPAGVKQAQKGPDGIETVTVDQAIEKMKEGMRKEGLLRDTKITWKTAWVRDHSGNTVGQIGEFNKFLPHMRVPGYSATFSKFYYIQNARIMKANGERTSLTEILALDPQAHNLVEEAYKNFMAQAEQLDPMLCRHCREYSADSVDDAQRHLVNAHPDVVQAMLKQEPVLAGPVPPVAPEQNYKCETCSKAFSKKQALIAHRRFGHKSEDRVL